MDDKELALAVATEMGATAVVETNEAIAQRTDKTRTFGIAEGLVLGGFIASCAQVEVQIWQARQDRALLLLSLLEKAPNHPRLDPEQRLGVIGRIVNRLIPDRLGASPSIGAGDPRSKQEWLNDWLGMSARTFTPTVLMPFADMENFIVYKAISWVPPEGAAGAGFPSVITVPTGFVTDLATVPWYFWTFLPPAGKYGHAAILHDWLYWEQQTTREVADRIFDVAMDEMSVTLAVRKTMWAAVRVYGGSYWNAAQKERQEGGGRVIKRLPDTQVTWKEWRTRANIFDSH